MSAKQTGELLTLIRINAPALGWNAETDYKFVNKRGHYIRYDMAEDTWFACYDNGEHQVDTDFVNDWIDDLIEAS
jgi:hypothetical protein